MKLRIPGFRNTRAKVARRAAPVLRFLAAPRRPPLKVIEGGGVTFPATSYVSQLRGYSTGSNPGSGSGNDGNNSEGKRRAPLRHRIRDAWRNTPTKWYPLPVGVGAVLLAVIHYRRQHTGAAGVFATTGDTGVVYTGAGDAVRISGPWQVHVLAALPLRSLSRLWGTLNTLELPVWMRPAGFKLYAWIFGCNLDEMKDPDLTNYASLGEFFYRELADGVRPIANSALVSPADGTVLHFGSITHDGRVEQVKGLTYSLDALLGSGSRSPSPASTPAALPTPPQTPPNEFYVPFPPRDPAHQQASDMEFANVNGIDYSLDQLLGRSADTPRADENTDQDATKEEVRASKPREPEDASVGYETDTIEVATELGLSGLPPLRRTTSALKPDNELFFAVVYLAPGDYHRFHSPAAWVVERRRHFAGELFSVSPYIARRIANLFVLNERVALLGRWKYGFFSMIPVGATNVGSIVVNFDKNLRTNLRKRPPPGAFVEAHYTQASALLRGQPLARGHEMGGFKLGSTIVMVFEAPRGFRFKVKPGEKVKVGQEFGDVF
ncbi:phosphatidylserine decarboxylase family protein [Rhizoctonia solani]|uniref:Phosphatidylserine decarboxylase proenzyme 1, mitochondrial n=1 Tax=Rhizoctonia solani TaxID=456999 RepID=A0A8H8NR50_9AGAM|nr:phosphatidylserine decarboxylase family protein [Rhizoctonia solani]QRW17070.1 phosphatidylserine decarboxylase family protein [Rhizoctonia solani]